MFVVAVIRVVMVPQLGDLAFFSSQYPSELLLFI